MNTPFARHDRRHYAQRPSWGKGATINGKPAWLVAEERRKAATQQESSK